jgi:hypothetical protein
MSAIPLHLQRIFEQRWAAKLASLGVSAARKTTELNSPQQPATPSENVAVAVAVADLGVELARAG